MKQFRIKNLELRIKLFLLLAFGFLLFAILPTTNYQLPTVFAQTGCDTNYYNDKLHVCYSDNWRNPEIGNTLAQQDDPGSIPSPVGAFTAVNRDWGDGQVTPTTWLDNVAGIWRGRVNFRAGTYTFYVSTDDGATLDLEGYGRVIDQWWYDQSATYSYTVTFTAAGYRNIQLRWFDNTNIAFIDLRWSYTLPPPPTASITGPSSGATGDALSYAVTASGTNLSKIEIWRSRTTAEAWTQVAAGTCSGLNCNLTGAWTPSSLETGPWYVMVNVFDSDSKQCTGNPFGRTFGWADCGSTDSVTTTITTSPSGSPPPATTCGSGIARATGLVSTLLLTFGTKFNTSSGACIIDPRAAFAPFKIPTYDDLKVLYFDKSKLGPTQKITLTGNQTQSTATNPINLAAPVALIVRDNNNTVSTYSPWVMYEPGWDRYVMFFNSMNNVDGDGTYKDRIYQIENFGDGINNWGPSYSVLFPDVDPRPGESGLIADPAVVRTDVWHMYYTGTDGDGTDFSVMTNNIFHATSPDKMTWTKQGMVTDLPVGVIGQYGVGEPSVIYEDGIYRLFYFFSSGLGIAETRVAESSDGYNFTDKGKVVTWTVPNPLQPDVRKEGSEYVLTYTDLTTAIYQSRSSNPYSFPVGVKLLDKQDWFSEYLITPNYLPNEGKLYFAGQTAKDFVGQDTQIGVSSVLGDRLYYVTGDLTVSSNITVDQTGVVFVDGNLNINTDLINPNNNTGLVFVVKGDVIINQSVTQVDAVIISSGRIYTAGAGCSYSSPITASQLVVNGSLIALDSNNKIALCRTLAGSGNTTTPAEVVNHQPKYLVILKDLLSDTLQKWAEIP